MEYRTKSDVDIMDVCRLCSRTEQLKSVFNEIKYPRNIIEIIEVTAGVTITTKDNVSHKLCEQCIDCSIKLFKFRANSLINDTELRALADQKPKSSLDETVDHLLQKYPKIKLPSSIAKCNVSPVIKLNSAEVSCRLDEFKKKRREKKKRKAELKQTLELEENGSQAVTDKNSENSLSLQEDSNTELPEIMIVESPEHIPTYDLTGADEVIEDQQKSLEESSVPLISGNTCKKTRDFDLSPPKPKKIRRTLDQEKDSTRHFDSLKYINVSLSICDICNGILYSPEDLKKHKVIHLRCSLCRKVFESYKEKNEHIEGGCSIKQITNNLPNIQLRRCEESEELLKKYPNAFGFQSDENVEAPMEEADVQMEVEKPHEELMKESPKEEPVICTPKSKLNLEPTVITLISDDEDDENQNVIEKNKSTDNQVEHQISCNMTQLSNITDRDETSNSNKITSKTTSYMKCKNKTTDSNSSNSRITPNVEIVGENIFDVDYSDDENSLLKNLLRKAKSNGKDASIQTTMPSNSDITSTPNKDALFELKNLREYLSFYKIPINISLGAQYSARYSYDSSHLLKKFPAWSKVNTKEFIANHLSKPTKSKLSKFPNTSSESLPMGTSTLNGIVATAEKDNTSNEAITSTAAVQKTQLNKNIECISSRVANSIYKNTEQTVLPTTTAVSTPMIISTRESTYTKSKELVTNVKKGDAGSGSIKSSAAIQKAHCNTTVQPVSSVIPNSTYRKTESSVLPNTAAVSTPMIISTRESTPTKSNEHLTNVKKGYAGNGSITSSAAIQKAHCNTTVQPVSSAIPNSTYRKTQSSVLPNIAPISTSMIMSTRESTPTKSNELVTNVKNGYAGNGSITSSAVIRKAHCNTTVHPVSSAIPNSTYRKTQSSVLYNTAAVSTPMIISTRESTPTKSNELVTNVKNGYAANGSITSSAAIQKAHCNTSVQPVSSAISNSTYRKTESSVLPNTAAVSTPMIISTRESTPTKSNELVTNVKNGYAANGSITSSAAIQKAHCNTTVQPVSSAISNSTYRKTESSVLPNTAAVSTPMIISTREITPTKSNELVTNVKNGYPGNSSVTSSASMQKAHCNTTVQPVSSAIPNSTCRKSESSVLPNRTTVPTPMICTRESTPTKSNELATNVKNGYAGNGSITSSAAIQKAHSNTTVQPVSSALPNSTYRKTESSVLPTTIAVSTPMISITESIPTQSAGRVTNVEKCYAGNSSITSSASMQKAHCNTKVQLVSCAIPNSTYRKTEPSVIPKAISISNPNTTSHSRSISSQFPRPATNVYMGYGGIESITSNGAKQNSQFNNKVQCIWSNGSGSVYRNTEQTVPSTSTPISSQERIPSQVAPLVSVTMQNSAEKESVKPVGGIHGNTKNQRVSSTDYSKVYGNTEPNQVQFNSHSPIVLNYSLQNLNSPHLMPNNYLLPQASSSQLSQTSAATINTTGLLTVVSPSLGHYSGVPNFVTNSVQSSSFSNTKPSVNMSTLSNNMISSARSEIPNVLACKKTQSILPKSNGIVGMKNQTPSRKVPSQRADTSSVPSSVSSKTNSITTVLGGTSSAPRVNISVPSNVFSLTQVTTPNISAANNMPPPTTSFIPHRTFLPKPMIPTSTIQPCAPIRSDTVSPTSRTDFCFAGNTPSTSNFKQTIRVRDVSELR